MLTLILGASPVPVTKDTVGMELTVWVSYLANNSWSGAQYVETLDAKYT